MKTLLAIAAALFLSLACSCACSGRSSRSGEEAVVVGTVVDAATGKAVSGVRLAGPQGAAAVSGRDGRFEMGDLRAGDSGEIVAKTDDGRRGGVTLRPLAPGRLEVVVQLYRR